MDALRFFLFAIALLLASSGVHAETSYKFIRMTCDPVGKSVTIVNFSDQDEAGRNRTEHPDKDVYALGERSAGPSHAAGECDLSGDQSVAFSAYQHAAASDDTFKLSFNHQDLDQTFLLKDDWTMSIRQDAENDFTVTYCPKASTGLVGAAISGLDTLRNASGTKCKDMEWRNGAVVTP